MGPIEFQIFTQFHLHRERICSEITHEKRQRAIEKLVSVLYRESEDAAGKLTKLQRDAAHALILQQDLLAGQAHMEDAIVNSVLTVEATIIHAASKVQGRINQSMDLSKNLSAVQLDGIRAHHLELGRLAQTSQKVSASLERIDVMVSNQVDAIERASETVKSELSQL